MIIKCLGDESYFLGNLIIFITIQKGGYQILFLHWEVKHFEVAAYTLGYPSLVQMLTIEESLIKDDKAFSRSCRTIVSLFPALALLN